MTTSSDTSSRLVRPELYAPAGSAMPASVWFSGKHIGALDGVRGLAIILVLLFHYGRSARGFDLSNPLLDACEFGWIGVDLFFVLSGFLITGILYDSRESPNYFRNFYARRALRIFPLYYLALFFVVALSMAWPHAGVWGNWSPLWIAFYLTNIALTIGHQPATGILSHFWSLAIEEHFYLMWPLVVLFGTRRRLMAVAAGLIVFSLALRIVLTLNGIQHGLYFLTPTRFDSLAIGAICALAVRGPNGIEPLVKYAWIAMLLCGPAVLAIVISTGSLGPDDPLMRTIGYTLLALVFGGLIIASLSSRPLGALFNRPIMRWFGRYSYGIYVWHVIINVLLFYTPIKAWLGIYHWAENIAYLGFAFAVTLLVSYASYHLWEKRFLMLKHRFE